MQNIRPNPDPIQTARVGRVLFALFLSALVYAGSGCRASDPDKEPVRLRIVVVPNRGIEDLKKRYDGLASYLSARLNLPCDLLIEPTYQGAVDAFVEGRAELAFLGGATFVLASQRTGAVPLVMREVDQHFVSVIVSRADDPRNALADFRGGTIAFADRLSTSGNLAPRYFLSREGIDPDQLFSKVIYTDTEVWTGTLVEERPADLAVLTSLSFELMQKTDLIKKNALKIVWQSPAYQSYVWASPSTLPQSIRARIRDAFLDLTMENPVHRGILKSLESTGYLPASMDELDPMRKMITTLQAAGKVPSFRR